MTRVKAKAALATIGLGILFALSFTPIAFALTLDSDVVPVVMKVLKRLGIVNGAGVYTPPSTPGLDDVLTTDPATGGHNLTVTNGDSIVWDTRGSISATADGVVKLTNNAGTGFSRLAFGGTTNTFPALKRSGAELQARLADDSAGAVFSARSLVASEDVVAGASNYLYWSTRSIMSSPSDGVITLTDQALATFGRIQLGGTTSAFPSIKRSGTTAAFRLADDSADAPITASQLNLSTKLVAGSAAASPEAHYLQQASATNGSLKYVVSCLDSTASFAAGNGSGVQFTTLFDGVNAAGQGGIGSFKENGTSGNALSSICISVNDNAAIVEAVRWTSGRHTQIPSGSVYGFSSSATNAAAADTGFSRVSAGVAALGNGTAGNTSGTLRLTTLQAIAGARTCSGGAYIFTTSTTDTTAAISAQLTRPSAGAISCDGATPGDATSSFYCGYLYPFEMELSSGKIAKYLNVTTAGHGVAPIRASATIAAQSSNATITSYANVAADGVFEVSASMNVTAATSISTSINVTYTDVSNAAQTLVLPLQKAGGTGGTYLTTGLAITTGDFVTPRVHIRVKASTTITILTAVGTFTGVTYSAAGQISRIDNSSGGG